MSEDKKVKETLDIDIDDLRDNLIGTITEGKMPTSSKGRKNKINLSSARKEFSEMLHKVGLHPEGKEGQLLLSGFLENISQINGL